MEITPKIIFIIAVFLLLSSTSQASQIPGQSTQTTGHELQASLRSAIQVGKLTASDGGSQDHFGYSVSLDGNRAVLGAYKDNDQGTDSGAAYVFDFDGSNWVESAKLIPNDGDAGDFFGRQVSLLGDRVVINALFDDDKGTDAGAVYVFDFDGANWIQSAKLTASDGTTNDQFGLSVSLTHDRLVAGAYRDDDNGFDSGSAYVYEYNGVAWTETAKLLASDGASTDSFGSAVFVENNRILIGASQNDDAGNNSGSAYVFDYDGTNWVQITKLLAADAQTADNFGTALALSGDRAVVGSYLEDTNGPESGAAYVFDFDGSIWSQSAKLLASDGADSDRFGAAVSIENDRVLIGAFLNDENGIESGAAYMFQNDGVNWSQTDKIMSNDSADYDWFGFAVSLSGNQALIGAWLDDDNGTNSGSAYVFDVTPDYNLKISVSELAGGTVSFSNGSDTLDVTADGTYVLSTLVDGSAFDVDLTAQPTSPNQACYFSSPATGTLNGADFTVTVSCFVFQYDVSVSVTGLATGNSLGLTNGTDQLTINGDGTQVISTLDDGSAYDVGITSQPTQPNQLCAFVNANAGQLEGADYTVDVTCVTEQYAVGGTLAGLAAGNEGILKNNRGDDLTVTANGLFTFANSLDDESLYAVTVLTDPTSPNQTCVVNQGTGQINGAEINSVEVTCVTDVHAVGGTVSGLANGNAVTLNMNGGDELLVVNGNGSYQFVNDLEDSSTFTVTVANNPTSPNQSCSITHDTGVIMGADDMGVDVACVTNTYFIGGTVNGLLEGNWLWLQNNGTDNLVVSSDGAFVFPTPLADEGNFDVTVLDQPNNPIQPCQVINGVGSLVGNDVDTVLVECELGDDLIFRNGFNIQPVINH